MTKLAASGGTVSEGSLSKSILPEVKEAKWQAERMHSLA